MPSVSRGWCVVIERIEQLVFLALNTHLLMKFWPGMFQPDHIISTLYVFNQTIVVVFLLIRRSAQNISWRPGDHLVATVSTLLPLLVQPPTGNSLLPLPVLFLMLLLGIMLHLGAKLTLRRSFGILPANRGIKSDGLYRFVRHPMYLGYIFSELSLILAGPTAWNATIFIANCLLFGVRISAEERVLGQSSEYREFCRTTPYRLVPGLY